MGQWPLCHPAHEDDLLAELSSFVEPRYRELEALVSPRVHATLLRLGTPVSRL